MSDVSVPSFVTELTTSDESSYACKAEEERRDVGNVVKTSSYIWSCNTVASNNSNLRAS